MLLVQYKVADRSDLDAMVRAGDALFDNAIKPEQAEAFFDDPNHFMMLAYHESLLVGMASAMRYYHPDKAPGMFIMEAGVIEAYQSKGIGRNLIREVCRVGRDEGCKEIWIATEISNMAAQKCYLGAGAKQDDELAVVFNF